MIIKWILFWVLVIYPPKPNMTLKFRDISLTQTLALAKLYGFKNETNFLPKGKIGFLLIEVRTNIITVQAKSFYIQGDNNMLAASA